MLPEFKAPPERGAPKRTLLLADIASHRLFLAAMRVLFLAEKANFNPAQPRVPAGDPDGGQWTDTGVGNGRLRRIAGANEEETRPRRSIVDETLDPTGELRTEAYNNALQKIRQLEPGNPQLESITTLNYVPSWQTVNESEAELEAARSRVAYQIGQGHAFDDHADEFDAENSAEFTSIVRSTISDPRSRVLSLSNGRTAFYLSSTNTLVIVSPQSADGGTMFRPIDGQSFVDTLD